MKELTNIEELEIVDLYKNKRIAKYKIAKLLKLTSRKVSKILNKYKIINNEIIRKKKYKVNEGFFEKIDTHDKAYFLGWLLADGNVSGKTKEGYQRYTIRIGIQIRDIKILKIFKKCLDSNIPVVKTRRKGHPDDGCSFTINSRKMWNDLQKLGVTPRKSLTLEFPNIDDKFQISMIRGYFDGDGSIRIYKQREFCFDMVGTKNFVTKIADILKPYANMGVYPSLLYKTKGTNVFYVKTGNKNNILKLLERFYQDDLGYLRLDRKYEKYLYIKKELARNPVKIQYINNAL